MKKKTTKKIITTQTEKTTTPKAVIVKGPGRFCWCVARLVEKKLNICAKFEDVKDAQILCERLNELGKKYN